jgi:PPK2 family polyphosphate:nucleotide phosphotransferase
MELYRIKFNQKLQLEKDIDPDDLGDWKDKKEKGVAKLAGLHVKLDSLQEVLYAEHKHKVLVVLQGMDAAGKDGTIRSVFEGVNPQGVKVASFKVPTLVEADHDFLWRIHAQAPGKGELVLFNRSHYEQVLVVRVHNLEPESDWRKHYQQINDFERMLTETGTTIIKCFLHISLDEQKRRLMERLDTPEKRWKFNPGDLPERKLWPEYMKAYQEAISATSTDVAPWYVIPSNHNWYRNLMVASLVVDELTKLDMHYPPEAENLSQYRKQLEME